MNKQTPKCFPGQVEEKKGRGLIHKAFPSSDHLQAMCLAISTGFLQPSLSFASVSVLLSPFTYHAQARQHTGLCCSLNQRKQHQVNVNQFTSVVAGLVLTRFSDWFVT